MEDSRSRILTTHVLRAGASENPPWVAFDGGTIAGVEPDLINAFAASLGARRWHRN